MHEATVALAILNRALAAVEARAHKETNTLDAVTTSDTIAESDHNTPPIFDVVKIVVNVGEFRNIDSESLEFTFSALRKDFPLTQNTELEIRTIQAIASCSVQHHRFHPAADNYFACTICGGGIGKLLSGKELDIINIEMEQRLKETAA